MNATRKRLTPALFVLFLVILAGLTVYSHTLQTMTLPKVIAEKPASRMMTHLIQGSGKVMPRRQDELASDSGWKVKKVHVKPGDAVAKGQALVTFDGSELEQTLLDEEAELQKRLRGREELQERFKLAARDGDTEEMRKAKRDLQNGRVDEEIARRKLNARRREWQQKLTLTAPYAGFVADVQAREGLRVSQGQTAITMMSSGEGFQFSFVIDADAAALLAAGEEFPVAVRGAGQAKGTITEIKADAPFHGASGGADGGKPGGGTENPQAQAIVVVALSGKTLKGGEQASVQIEKPSPEEGLVLRKAYLRKDSRGYYVFVVEENRSSLGNHYYVKQKYIRILDETSEEAVVEGLNAQDQIVAESSEPLRDGDPVRL